MLIKYIKLLLQAKVSRLRCKLYATVFAIQVLPDPRPPHSNSPPKPKDMII